MRNVVPTLKKRRQVQEWLKGCVVRLQIQCSSCGMVEAILKAWDRLVLGLGSWGKGAGVGFSLSLEVCPHCLYSSVE